MHCWFVKTESEVPLQLPRFMNTPIELLMSSWMDVRRKWDGAIAKRASMGRALTPASAKLYQQFLDNPYRKVVFDLKNRKQVSKPSSAQATTLKDCLLAEIKMSMDPAHLSIRFGEGPFFHLFVRQFEVLEVPWFLPGVSTLLSKIVRLSFPPERSPLGWRNST